MYLNEKLFIDFLNNKEILWTGINFSKAKFTRQGFEFSQEVMQRYFFEWNMLIINDQKKYDIRMSFRKPIMQYDLSLVTKINKTVKVNNLLVPHIGLKDILSEEEILAAVNSYSITNDIPYALTLVVESFDAAAKSAAIWVVIIQTESGEVVLCERFIKNPAGTGARSYWGRTFYNLFFDIKNHDFLRWESLVNQDNDVNETTPIILT